MNILLIILELSSKFQISFSLNVLIIKLLIYFIIAACKFVFLWTFYGLLKKGANFFYPNTTFGHPSQQAKFSKM